MSSVFIDWLIQPLGMVVSLLLLAFALLLRPGAASLPMRLSFGSALVLLWLMAAPLPANALLDRMELLRSGPPGCETSSHSLPVVVPGGGMNAWRNSASPYEILDADSQVRVQGAVDHASPDAQFYLLGGGRTGRTLATHMTSLLTDRGIPRERIVEESRSTSTRENAAALRALLPPGEGSADKQGIRLVTSALHLRRASRLFEREGYRVCGLGVGSLNSPALGIPAWLPWMAALERSTQAWRELLATVADGVRMRLDPTNDR